MKRITLENASFGLFTDLPPICENGEEKEDDRSNAMFTELANSLLNEFTPLCKDPFTLEIREFKCGEDEPHSYARIALLDDKGHDAVVGTKKKPVFCLDATQYYAARNRDDPDQNYMGKLVIRVFMYFLKPRKSSSDDEGSHLAENLLAYVLLRLASMHYYEQIAEYFTEWDTDYRDAPKISLLGISKGP